MNTKIVRTNRVKGQRKPDKRIIITDSILVIEYSNGSDLLIKRGDPRAERIVSQISL